MNKEWSELNKTMQSQIKKKDTYKMGIDTLCSLRSQLMQTLVSFKEELCREEFNAIPFKLIYSMAEKHNQCQVNQCYGN